MLGQWIRKRNCKSLGNIVINNPMFPSSLLIYVLKSYVLYFPLVFLLKWTINKNNSFYLIISIENEMAWHPVDIKKSMLVRPLPYIIFVPWAQERTQVDLHYNSHLPWTRFIFRKNSKDCVLSRNIILGSRYIGL